MTKKQYETIALIGIAVLFIYFIGSFWIREYWYIRAGMGLMTIFIIFAMLVSKYNKIIILITLILLSLSIIFYHEIQGFLV